MLSCSADVPLSQAAMINRVSVTVGALLLDRLFQTVMKPLGPSQVPVHLGWEVPCTS